MDTQNIANAVTKAIGYTENGGKPNPKNPKQGKTGETKSIFQFEPATWKNYSQEVFGKTDVPMTPDTEAYVVHQKVTKWLDAGNTPQQIFSMWNAGAGEPNAYTGKFSDGSSSSGINKKYGVKYNVPQYVDTAMKYYNEFSQSNSTATNSQLLAQNQVTQPISNIPVTQGKPAVIPGMLPNMTTS